MTVGKNTGWGAPGSLPAGSPIIDQDREARRIVEAARRSAQPVPLMGLRRGDLARTVGAPPDGSRLRSADAMVLPMDLGVADLDGERHHFVAHLVIRRSWWRGRIIAVMNAQWIGRWDVAPKSHPNDGILDVFDSDLSLDDRLKARSRLVTGTHVPHPGIRQRRTDTIEFDLGFPTPVWLDGEKVACARTVSVAIEPDAWAVVV